MARAKSAAEFFFYLAKKKMHVYDFEPFHSSKMPYKSKSKKKLIANTCRVNAQKSLDNLPKAIQVDALAFKFDTVWKWECRMYRWMDAHRSRLSARDAQFKVKVFSSRKYLRVRATALRGMYESLIEFFFGI